MNSQHWEYFIFDDIRSSAYGVWISGEDTFQAPERDVETIFVPGRNGALTIDSGRYNNVQIIYPCYMSRDFADKFSAFKGAIMSKVGYKKLVDTYHPGGFRKARITKGFTPETGPYNRSASFDVIFDCYPQFFLDSGATFYEATEIINPTNYKALPLIEVTFSSSTRTGTVTVNGRTISITGAEADTIYIDSESQNAYYISSGVAISQNGKIAVPDDFPFLAPGFNPVASTGNISSVKIKPRWWTT